MSAVAASGKTFGSVTLVRTSAADFSLTRNQNKRRREGAALLSLCGFNERDHLITLFLHLENCCYCYNKFCCAI